MKISTASVLLGTLAVCHAQFPQPPRDVKIQRSTKHPGVFISYKETHICEEHSKAWAGYVRLPPSYTSNDAFNASVFFWYFEARHDPQNAPTTLYFAGGPGQSSMYGALSDGGPCTVFNDSNSTQNNPWSMNTYSNMLYIDQPLGTGFSYDALVKSTLNLINDPTGLTLPSAAFSSYNGTVPPQNSTFYYGILPSSDIIKTTPTSIAAAQLTWHFSQIWFTEFPHWKSKNKRINLWGNSYGGFWTLITGQYFLQQNEKIKAGKLRGVHILELDTIGFTNGIVDFVRQLKYSSELLYNNTYGVEVISKEVYDSARHNLTEKGGCNDQMQACRQLGQKYDPRFTAANASVNEVCVGAFSNCFSLGSPLAVAANKSSDDIAHPAADPFPLSNLVGFLNRAWVQEALGVPVNFTADSSVVQSAYVLSGDFIRTEGFLAMEKLLKSGVQIAMINGDRDPDVPWTSAEALSLEADWNGADDFRKARYVFVSVNESYAGGFVRQHGNLSFTRVFQSGHDVAAYQPETNFKIFNRAIQHRDIATGKQELGGCESEYSTKGPSSTWFFKQKLPPPPPLACYTRIIGTCSPEQIAALADGTAVIEDWYVVKPAQ